MGVSSRVAELCIRSVGIALLGLFLSPSDAAAGSLRLAWDPSSGPSVGGYVVYYGLVSGVYTWSVNVGNTTTYTFNGLTNGTTYYFTVKAYSTSGVFSGPSNQVSGVPSNAFTDDPLISGVTAIRAIHLVELRARIDALRTRFALPAFSWTDPAVVPGAVTVKSVHLAQMRSALGSVYAALKRTTPVYTDTALTGVPVKAVHLTELRAAILAVE